MPNKILKIIFLLSLLLPTSLFGEEVRTPKFAEKFYPDSAPLLIDTIDEYLDEVPKKAILGRIVSLIVPHAGYRFSGRVAAFAYKQIRGKRWDTVVIIGPSHRKHFPGISIYREGGYKTPLGVVEIDKELATSIINEHKAIGFLKEAHLIEHSIEVQIPFLQRCISNFKIVPILMGDQSKKYCEILSKALFNNLKNRKRVLLIATSDFSHYLPYDKAVEVDRVAIRTIEKMNPALLLKKMEKRKCELCGGGPVVTLLMISKKLGADRVKLLNYANSGDVTEVYWRVVGYASFVLYSLDKLSKKAQEELLRVARSSIENYVKGKKVEVSTELEELKMKRGVFVTINKRGKLRGCIGYVFPIRPLVEACSAAAIKAAVEDKRFPPLEAGELKEIELEISVLSPLAKIENIEEIEIGRHGLYIKRGWQSGLLLPQVPSKYGWSREEFLSETCKKAGLPPNAWKKREDVEIYIFEAQVFEE